MSDKLKWYLPSKPKFTMEGGQLHMTHEKPMTDAEKQVAGKTYRYTNRHHKEELHGEKRVFDGSGRCVNGMVWAESMISMVVNGYAEEVPPEVKVGDRFEVMKQYDGTAIRPGDVITVKSVMSDIILVSDNSVPASTWPRKDVVECRRLQPEPARPLCSPTDDGTSLCECGAEAGRVRCHGMEYLSAERVFVECGCRARQCQRCYVDDPNGAAARHRALNHPEPKEDPVKAHWDRIAERWQREMKAGRIKACYCLSLECRECSTKMAMDEKIAVATKKAEAERASVSRQALPVSSLYSPTAMMGGMWPVHGRK